MQDCIYTLGSKSYLCIGYSAAQAVSVTIPTSAKTSNTVLRWRQLGHDGATTDEWAIDHVRLSNDRDVSLFGDNFDTASIPYVSSTACILKSIYRLYLL